MDLEQRGERPKLSGMDAVFVRNMRANLTFPQNYLSIDSTTLHALLGEPEPRALLARYLTEPLATKQAEKLLDVANRAHRAYGGPIIEIDGALKVWNDSKLHIQGLLSKLLTAPEYILYSAYNPEQKERFLAQWVKESMPDDTLRVLQNLLSSTVSFLARTDIQEKYTRYRNVFKEGLEKDARDAKLDEVYEGIHAQLITELDTQRTTLDEQERKIWEIATTYFERTSCYRPLHSGTKSIN